MSAVALLRAVEARLRSVLSDPDGQRVGVQDSGSPPPFAGQVYYAVWWAGCQAGEDNPLSLDKVHGVNVSLTWRMGYAPRDRKGARILASGELLEKAEAVADALHCDYTTMNAANALIPGTADYASENGGSVTTSGFVEPLRLSDIGQPREEGPDWIGAADGADLLVIDVRMVGARRVTSL